MIKMDITLQYKIWIDYMVTQLGLKYHKFECIYPTHTEYKFLWKDIKIKTFDQFTQKIDRSSPDNLCGWYWRFEQRINKL